MKATMTQPQHSRGWYMEKNTREMWRWDGDTLHCLVDGRLVNYGVDDESFRVLRYECPLKAKRAPVFYAFED